jgi:dTDP-4-amino-4,6-dideoxygalactose transaminase
VPLAFEHPVYVTRPLLPNFDVYADILTGVWRRRWLTNGGALHLALEQALCACLRVDHLALVNSGTTALLLAARALDLTGEVVTTPLTSPATVGAMTWCGLTPVFADVDPETLTLAPEAVERAITPRTTAIVGTHLYGMPCDVEALGDIGRRHGLRILYDGAHAFGTTIDDVPVTRFGDATALSFHATKLFNTAEGGAVVAQEASVTRRVEQLRNLGMRDEVTVAAPGINGRMSELAAALGLANLDGVEAERRRRAEIARVYASRLAHVPGMRCFELPRRVGDSCQYFIVRVDHRRSPISRDDLYERLKTFNVFARRYFYPLCSEIPAYRDLASSTAANLPIAHRASREVLALPFYGDLGVAGAERICDMVECLATTAAAP